MSSPSPFRKLRGAAVDAVWRAAPRRRLQVEATWPLAGWEVDRLAIAWPESYGPQDAGPWVEPLRRELARLLPVDPAEIAQPYPGVVVARFALDDDPHDVAIDYSRSAEVNGEALADSDLYFKTQFPPGADPRVVPGGLPPPDDRLYRYLPRLRRLRDRRRFSRDVYGPEAGEHLGYGERLREVARSKVCLHLPADGCIDAQLVDYMAVGACVVGPVPRTQLPVPLIDGEHVVYARDDLSDLDEVCRRYAEDDDARERLAANAREYFDRHLDGRQLASWYVRTALDRLA